MNVNENKASHFQNLPKHCLRGSLLGWCTGEQKVHKACICMQWQGNFSPECKDTSSQVNIHRSISLPKWARNHGPSPTSVKQSWLSALGSLYTLYQAGSGTAAAVPLQIMHTGRWYILVLLLGQFSTILNAGLCVNGSINLFKGGIHCALEELSYGWHDPHTFTWGILQDLDVESWFLESSHIPGPVLS